MKNQQDYFPKIILALKDLKNYYSEMEVCKHLMLATDGLICSMTDKELYHALMKHKAQLDMNTLSDQDMQRVIEETDDLFTEVEPEDEDLEDEY